MSKNIKKILLALLSVICLACFAVGCSDSAVDFTDFKDEEVTAYLGQNYQLDLTPIVCEENYYEIIASVKDSEQKQVEINGSYFTVKDVNGYTIIYTATNGDDEHSRTVTVKVENKRAPNIVIKEEFATTFRIGDTFKFPTPTVYDLANEAITPTAKVYKLVSGEYVEQELTTATTFLCQTVGSYKLVFSATNSFNVTGDKEVEFFVRPASQVGEVEAFGDEGSKVDTVIDAKYVTKSEWIEKTDASMGERQGVLKLDVKETGEVVDVITVYPNQDYSKYLEKGTDEKYKNKYLVFSIYVDAPEGSIAEMYPFYWSEKFSQIKYNMWFDYIFDASGILGLYDRIANPQNYTDVDVEKEKTNAHGLFLTALNEVTIYIDKIAFTEGKTEITTSGVTSFAYGTEISLKERMTVQNAENVEYTVMLEGKPIATTKDKFTPEYVSDKYSVTVCALDAVNEVAENITYDFSVTAMHTASLNEAEYTKIVNPNEEYVLPKLSISDGTSDVSSDYTFTTQMVYISNAGERANIKTFSSANSGRVEFTLKAVNKTTGVKFIKTASVSVGPYGANEVVFASRKDVVSLFGKAKATVLEKLDFEAEIKNAYGFEKVIRFTKSATDKNDALKLNFKPVYDKAYYNDEKNAFDKVSFPMYLKSKLTAFNVEILGQNFSVKANEWTTLEVPISALVTAIEKGQLFNLNTWKSTPIVITAEEGDTLSYKELELYLGDITVRPKTAEEIATLSAILNGVNQDNYTQYKLGTSTGEYVSADKLSFNGLYNGNAVAFRSVGGSALTVNYPPENNLPDKGEFYVWVAISLKSGTTPAGVWYPNGNAGSGIFRLKTWNNDGNTTLYFDSTSSRNQFNTWYKISVPVETANQALKADRLLKLFTPYTNADWKAENYTLYIGDIGVEAGDNFVNENDHWSIS